MKVVFALGLIVVVVAIVVAVVNVMRSRAAKTDWIDELDEIRMTSLGDAEEVTGALHAVPADVRLNGEDWASGDSKMHLGERVSESDADQEADAATENVALSEPEGAPENDGVLDSDAVPMTDVESDQISDRNEESNSDRVSGDVFTESESLSPTESHGDADRVISDAGMLFHEYSLEPDGLLRVEATDPEGLRVVTRTNANAPVCAVDLPRGSLWHRSTPNSSLSVRTPAGWLQAKGTLAVVVDDGWTFVMCIDGTVTLRVPGSERVSAVTGAIARMREGSDVAQVVNAGSDVLEAESIVRRHRRLDGEH